MGTREPLPLETPGQSPSPPSPLRPSLRGEWLLDDGITFLNHGSFGAVPRRVLEVQADWRRRIEAEPVELLARQGPELLGVAKRAVGGWLGMREEDFGFVTNATEGVNAVLRSLDLQPGDELLTTTHVYNAVRQTMRYVAQRTGAAWREVDVPVPVASPGRVVEAIISALRPATRLVILDHVTSPTALVFPVESVATACAQRGIDVLVDGAHAPGMLPLDVPKVGAAYYAGNLHKWTCAPKGSGFLWVRPDRQAGIHPLVISHPFGEGLAPEFAWQGTRDYSAWLSIPAGIEFMAELGWDRVRAYNHALAVWANRMLCARWGVEPLSPADGSMLGSMCTVPLPSPLGSLTDEQFRRLQQRLYSQHRVEAPIVLWAGRSFVRPCCQVYNTPEEYDRLANAVEALGREGL